MTGLTDAMTVYPLLWSSDFRSALMLAVPTSMVLWAGIVALAVRI